MVKRGAQTSRSADKRRRTSSASSSSSRRHSAPPVPLLSERESADEDDEVAGYGAIVDALAEGGAAETIVEGFIDDFGSAYRKGRLQPVLQLLLLVVDPAIETKKREEADDDDDIAAERVTNTDPGPLPTTEEERRADLVRSVRALANNESFVSDHVSDAESLEDVEIDVTEFIETSVVQRALLNLNMQKIFLTSKDAKDKQRAAKYSNFWRTLVASSGSDLYKLPHMQILSKWLIQLTTHSRRALRYSACHVAVEVLSGLVGVGGGLRTKVAEKRTQLAAASKTSKASKKKASKKKSGSVEAHITADLDRLLSHRGEVLKLIKVLTNSLMLRVKDCDETIRAKVVAAFGQWIPAFPVAFARNALLKQVSELLNDSQGIVREAATKAMGEVIDAATKGAAAAVAPEDAEDAEGAQERLVRFISRKNSAGRLQQMLQDPEKGVIKAAIMGVDRLLAFDAAQRAAANALSDQYDNLVKRETHARIEKLMFQPGVALTKLRKKAGALYASKAWRGGDSPAKVIVTVLEMARRNFARTETSAVAAFIVDALSDVKECSALDDPHAMVALLLGRVDGGGDDATAGGSKQAKKSKAKKSKAKAKTKGSRALLGAEQELLACVLRHRATRIEALSTTKKKGGIGIKAKKETFADATMNSLRELFARYKGSTAVLRELARLPRLVAPEWFGRKENKKVLGAILKELSSAFCRYGDSALLVVISDTLQALHAHDGLRRDARACFVRLFKNVAKQSAAALKVEAKKAGNAEAVSNESSDEEATGDLAAARVDEDDAEQETSLTCVLQRASILNKSRGLCGASARDGAVNIEALGAMLAARRDALRLMRARPYADIDVVRCGLDALLSHLTGDVEGLFVHLRETGQLAAEAQPVRGGVSGEDTKVGMSEEGDSESDDAEVVALQDAIGAQRDALALHVEGIMRDANSVATAAVEAKGAGRGAYAACIAYGQAVAKEAFCIAGDLMCALPRKFETCVAYLRQRAIFALSARSARVPTSARVRIRGAGGDCACMVQGMNNRPHD